MKLIIENEERPDDPDYETDRLYMQVNKIFDVQITKTEVGLQISVFPYGGIGDPIATCFAYDDDAREEARLDEPAETMSDAEADADVLRMAGMGTDEDYGYYGEEDWR